ncbi:MAG: helix-turn-helix domain-containing protein [Erysipelotrichaceae bacterium]|nr:helix-turn-helix domain-containing protein [Erysipelotrichaceae bacterium]
MTLGKTIKQLRKEIFLSQEQFAAKLNITAQAVSKWENDESYPDILFLPKIAAIFGVKIDDLFDYTQESAYQKIENMLDQERYFTLADFTKSESFLLQQLTVNPNDLHALTLLGDLYHVYAMYLDEKSAEYTKHAIELDPDNKILHGTFNLAMHGGMLDWNVANHSQLIHYYQNFIHEHPHISRAYLYLLDNLIDDGRLMEASVVLDKRKGIITDCLNDFYGCLIFEASHGFENTRVEYESYLKQYPDDWKAWFSVAGRYAGHGDYETAITMFEKSFTLQASPRYVDSLESIAQLYLRLNNFSAAKQSYKRVLQLLKDEWHQEDSSDVQRIRALIAKCTTK